LLKYGSFAAAANCLAYLTLYAVEISRQAIAATQDMQILIYATNAQC